MGLSTACKSQADQCNALVEKLDRVTAAKEAVDFRTPEAEQRYFDGMLAAKKELASVSIRDEKLVALQKSEVTNTEELIFVTKEIGRAVTPSELADAEKKRERLWKEHASNMAEVTAYCPTAPRAIAMASASSSKPGSAVSSASRPSPSGAPARDEWLTFRHPTLPFEAQFFTRPDVSERKGASSMTNAAIANDEHRMFSAAWIVLNHPAKYDCASILEVHINGKEDRLGCRRQSGKAVVVSGLPSFEALLECRGGGKMLKRVSCDARPKENRVILFDVEAIYLDGWNPDEARRFAESAKIVAAR